MIIRILNEGQYDVPDIVTDELNILDNRLQVAVSSDDPKQFTVALRELLAAVRFHGTPVPNEVLTSSELIFPAADSSIAQVSSLLGDEGLIPG